MLISLAYIYTSLVSIRKRNTRGKKIEIERHESVTVWETLIDVREIDLPRLA